MKERETALGQVGRQPASLARIACCDLQYRPACLTCCSSLLVLAKAWSLLLALLAAACAPASPSVVHSRLTLHHACWPAAHHGWLAGPHARQGRLLHAGGEPARCTCRPTCCLPLLGCRFWQIPCGSVWELHPASRCLGCLPHNQLMLHFCSAMQLPCSAQQPSFQPCQSEPNASAPSKLLMQPRSFLELGQYICGLDLPPATAQALGAVLAH